MTSKSLPFKIIFEDLHLIVLSKPAGLLSQGESTGDENPVDHLRAYLGRPYVGLVHRLDRNTSGLLVVAKRTKSARRLTESLQKDRLQRNYLAWVVGKLPREVRWTHFLLKNERTNQVQVRSSLTPGAKKAVLTARPVEYKIWNGMELTLAEFKLETGRSHQIRVQSAHEGFPLLGDRKYSNLKDGFARVALHSHQIEFPHPMSGEVLRFEDPLPEDMATILKKSF